MMFLRQWWSNSRVRDIAINSAAIVEATGPVPLANEITSIAVKLHNRKKSLKRQ